MIPRNKSLLHSVSLGQPAINVIQFRLLAAPNREEAFFCPKHTTPLTTIKGGNNMTETQKGTVNTYAQNRQQSLDMKLVNQPTKV